MDSYINSQLDFSNQLANLAQNSVVEIEAMQEFKSSITDMSQRIQSLVEPIHAYNLVIYDAISQMHNIVNEFNNKAYIDLEIVSKKLQTSIMHSQINWKNFELEIYPVVENFNAISKNMNGILGWNVKEKVCKCLNDIGDCTQSHRTIVEQWEGLAQSLRTFDFQNYSEILDTCDITKEEILVDIDATIEELENIDKFNLEIKIEDFWKKFAKKHIALWNILVVFGIMLEIGSKCNTFKNWYLPIIQETYVMLQGTEEYYYIKSEEAKVYANATSKADVICTIGYGEQVTQLEETNMWRKILYEDENGTETIGWVAKRNLLSQKDYQFNSNKLGE